MCYKEANRTLLKRFLNKLRDVIFNQIIHIFVIDTNESRHSLY